MPAVTVVGGGIAGLVASIACAEAGATVGLLEAHRQLGGRARSSTGPFVTNLGPHALYCDGPWWAWLAERELLPPVATPPLAGARFRHGQRAHRMPPLALLAKAIRLRRRRAPIELDFQSWAANFCGAEPASMLACAAGVFSFDADPGRLSAAFVWERLLRVNRVPSPVRYVIGGWSSLVERLEQRARTLGVAIETSARVEALPARPVIVATDLEAARQLLGDDSLRGEAAQTVLLDLGLRSGCGDPYLVYDLEQAGFAERFTAHDDSLAPPGHELIQAHIGRRPGESAEDATNRLETFLDTAFDDWRARTVWSRRQTMDGRHGALDLPGTTWRDRPAVDRGEGIFLAGDMVAAPGLLSEVAFNSAIDASRGALHRQQASRRPRRPPAHTRLPSKAPAQPSTGRSDR
jgi:phytoene dehydrogenase-like protein